jgi:peroxiredoxin
MSTRARSAISRTGSVCIGLLVTVLLVTACGSGRPDDAAGGRTAAPSPSRSPKPSAIAVRLEARASSGSGTVRFGVDLIALGDDHLRLTFRSPGAPRVTYIWDGRRLLVHDTEEVRPWHLYEVAAEHPEELEMVTAWLPDVQGAGFKKMCPASTPLGRARILGRGAHGYHCKAREDAEGSFPAFQLWLDDASGLTLRSGPFRARSIDRHPRITSSTFSTTPPAHTKADVFGAQGQASGKAKAAPPFQLERLGGGRVSLADYAGAPLVLAFFASDIYFDSHGEVCPRCLPALLTLQQYTHDGTDPAVLAVQGGDKGKPGYPLVPQGVNLTVANDPAFAVQHAYGLSQFVGFAFIDADGRVHSVIDRAPSDEELRAAVDSLR